MKILLLMKSEVAYNHLRRKFSQYYFAPYVTEEHAFRSVLGNFNADVAVVDIQLPWADAARATLDRFEIPIILFEGDFDDAIAQINAYAAELGVFQEEQADVKEEDEDFELFIPHIDIEPEEETDPFLTKKKEMTKPPVKVQLPESIGLQDQLKPKLPNEYEKEEKAEPKDDRAKKQRDRKKAEGRPEPVTTTVTEFAVLPSRMIIIGSLYPGAGSSFVSMHLARAFAAYGIPVTYVESPLNPKPYAFDALYLSNVLVDEATFNDMGKMILDKKIGQRKDTEIELHGVKWIVKDPQIETLRGFNYELMMRFVYAVKKTPIVIWDISNTWLDESVKNILPQADDLYLVVDPDPVKLDWQSNSHSQESKIIQLLKSYQSYLDYSIIANKDNDGVRHSTWEQCLTKKPAIYVPMIDAKYIYKALWSGEMPYDQEPVKAKLNEAFLPVIKKIIPEKYLKQQGKPNFLQLFRWR